MEDKTKSLKAKARKFPPLPGVYLIKKAEDQILYVGKAKSLRHRASSYFNKKLTGLKTEFLLRQAEDIDYIVTKNEVEAFLLEASLIKKHKPRYNIRLKDDKAYPYIRFSLQDDFPRLYFERRVKDSRSVYFGPYTEGWTVRSLLDFLNQNFHLRDCSDSEFRSRKRPCLSWDMGVCPAPCVKKISSKEYKKNCKKALSFLKGNPKNLAQQLKSQMRLRAKQLRFEEAGRLRDRLKAIEMIEQSQSVVQKSVKDKDVLAFQPGPEGSLMEVLHFRKGRLIGNRFHFFKSSFVEEEILLSFLNQYYSENLIPDELLLKMPVSVSKLKILEQALQSRKGEPCRILHVFNDEDKALIHIAEKNAQSHLQSEIQKEQSLQDALMEIKKRLSLPKIPLRMECFDISHWRGSEAFGAKVVFEKGQPAKKEYRLYKLKSARREDDYSALREALSRRLNHKEDEDPDLILIDGGKGQLQVAKKVLREVGRKGIALASLAKDKIKNKGTYHTKALSSGERFYLLGRKNPVLFPPQSKAFSILLHLRDEAHRMAIKTHRKRRRKMFLKGGLDSIKGLSPNIKASLLRQFGSLSALKKQSEKELSKLSFISKTLAQRIRKHFSNSSKK